jgi:hypothetical protein
MMRGDESYEVCVVRYGQILLLLLLVACSSDARPSAPATPTPLAFMLLSDVLNGQAGRQGNQLTTAGYLYADSSGFRLVDGITVSNAATPQPLSEAADQIWIGDTVPDSIQQALSTTGAIQMAVVLAQGRLDGPGTYGPNGAYRYQLEDPRLQPIPPAETSITNLLDNPSAYAGRYIRINGALLSSATAAVLVDKLGAGGVPDAAARQIKVRSPIRDSALLEQLQQSSNGSVRFGAVQVEGFWIDRFLIPLKITPLS